MPKRPFPAVALLALIFGISTQIQAAVHPDLTALAKGSVVQFTGSERIFQPFAFDLNLTVAPWSSEACGTERIFHPLRFRPTNFE